MEIVSVVFTEEAQGSHDRLRELYDEAVRKTRQLEDAILSGEAWTRTPSKAAKSKSKPLQSNWTRREFEEGVRKIKDYIAAGDCYQVVLSQRFSAKFKGDALGDLPSVAGY